MAHLERVIVSIHEFKRLMLKAQRAPLVANEEKLSSKDPHLWAYITTINVAASFKNILKKHTQ